MRISPRVPILLGLAALLCAPARAAEEPAATPSLRIGDPLPAFQAKDVEGHDFDFAKARSTTADEALAAVAKGAKARGATAVTRETSLDAIPGLAKDGTADPEARRGFAAELGRPLGLLPDPAAVAAWTTVGDAASWVEGAAKAPIVFVAWSSGCPTCLMYEERLAQAASSTGSRVYLLACNWNDPDEAILAAVAKRKVPFPVLIDRDQKVTGVLGGRKTPHVFVLDASNALRYAGAIDNDAALEGDPSKRAEWLKDALSALAAGRSSFDVLVTTPKG